MAELENNKPKTEKTSASVTSTLPRLCPTTRFNLKDTTCNIPKLKSRSLGNRPISDEYRKRSGVLEHNKTNLQKSKLTEFNDSGQVRYTSNNSLYLISPRNYHGQIPILHRHSLNFIRMSPPDTRSPSPLKKATQKEKSSSKIKTITLDTKKKRKPGNSRSPTPPKKSISNRKSKSRTSPSPIPGSSKNSERVSGPKCGDSSKQGSPRLNSPTKRKSKAKVFSSSNVEFSNSKQGKELQAIVGNTNSVVLKQASQPSLCTNDKVIAPQEKISLDCLKNEVYSGDHRRLAIEKVHLCIEKSGENISLAERKRSYLLTYSAEDTQKEDDISLAFLQNVSSTSIKSFADREKRKVMEEVMESKAAIRTLSGHELILTPSMKLDIDKETDPIEISQLLHDSAENFESRKEVHILQDDANEYDSEVSTDGEVTTKENENENENEKEIENLSDSVLTGTCNNVQNANSLWKSQEAALLNDVDYRQSVYHPAVSRRQKSDDEEVELKPKSKSIEDNYGKTTKRIVRSRSSSLKNKFNMQCYDKTDSCNNDRSWASSFDKNGGKPMYNSVIQDVPFYGIKRIRTKKERVTGALLRLAVKVIRLVAIFNLWPGDNCYMLTSQSLRFAR